MKRLRKVATREYDFFDFKAACAAADKYAKEDGCEYAVIHPYPEDSAYEVIVDDFDHPSEIPGIKYHTAK